MIFITLAIAIVILLITVKTYKKEKENNAFYVYVGIGVFFAFIIPKFAPSAFPVINEMGEPVFTHIYIGVSVIFGHMAGVLIKTWDRW